MNEPNPNSVPASNLCRDQPQPPFSPLSTPDQAALNAWFSLGATLPDIAAKLGISLLDLSSWSTQPHIAQAIDLIEQTTRRRAHSLLPDSQLAALARLTKIAELCPNDETARRAADRILRGLAPTEKRTPEPLPEGGVGVGSFITPQTETGRSDSSIKASTPEPLPEVEDPPRRRRVGVGLLVTPPSARGRSNRQHAAARQPIIPPAPEHTQPFQVQPPDDNPAQAAPPATPTNESLAAALALLDADQDEDQDAEMDAELDADLDDDLDADLDDDEQDRLDDEELDREAAETEARLGVSLLHPLILQAISEGRIQDLDQIAAQIRSQPP